MMGFIMAAAIATGTAAASPAPAEACKNAQGVVIKCPTKSVARKSCKAKDKTLPCGKVRTKETDVTSRSSYRW